MDVGIKLHLSCLPDDSVHVPGFGEEDTDVLELPQLTCSHSKGGYTGGAP
jgi:hypothetical protein